MFLKNHTASRLLFPTITLKGDQACPSNEYDYILRWPGHVASKANMTVHNVCTGFLYSLRGVGSVKHESGLSQA